MRGTDVASCCACATTTAAARVARSCGRYFPWARNAMSPGPADSRVATCLIVTSGLPISSPPRRSTISASMNARGAVIPLFRRLAVVQRLDDLVGDVDARACPDRFLEYNVVLLGLGDLLHRPVGALDNPRQLLVAALVEVLARLTLLALKLPVEIRELALALGALGLGHGHGISFQRILQALQLLSHLAEFLVALGEFLLDLLLRPHGRRGIPKYAFKIDIADPTFGLGNAAGGKNRQQGKKNQTRVTQTRLLTKPRGARKKASVHYTCN